MTVTTNLNTADQSSDTLQNGFTYAIGGGAPSQPAVTSVTPASGPNEGGTRVTINGEGFQSPGPGLLRPGWTAQGFTGVEATVESVTSNKIVVTTPPATGFGQNNLNQVVDLLVKNLGIRLLDRGAERLPVRRRRGGRAVRLGDLAEPGSVHAGGILVTVFGQGFDAPVAVEMGGVGQQIVSVTGTEIVVRTVPVDVDSCGDMTGATMVTNIETGESATGPDFRYRVPTPVITGTCRPGRAAQNGNTTVTITGSGLPEPAPGALRRPGRRGPERLARTAPRSS